MVVGDGCKGITVPTEVGTETGIVTTGVVAGGAIGVVAGGAIGGVAGTMVVEYTGMVTVPGAVTG